MVRKTYGEEVVRALMNETMDDDVIEYRRPMEQEVLKNIEHTVKEALKSPIYTGKDFYIVLLFKVERIGSAPRTFVFARQSCPTPIYKQSVWKYHRNASSLEFLWSIPDMLLYYDVLRNGHQLPKEEQELFKFVTLMESGELLEWVKKENGEKIDAVIKMAPPTLGEA